MAQIHKLNRDDIFDSVVFDKCCLTVTLRRFLIYLIQLYLINIAPQLKVPLVILVI